MARGLIFALTPAALLPGVLFLISCLQALAAISGNNLDGLIGNNELKFVFVGGKGGVGKTTSSSAIAAQLSLSINQTSKSNKRVLLISTDPAHSLSDAFRMKFSNVPTPILPDLPNLEVMEVNPQETMKKELSSWGDLARELGYDPGGNDEGETAGIGEKIHSFQQWLSGIPGIDEATALSSAIEHIESGRYDMIVFDTAPTGHTLKLLELPQILQVGLEKLEGWQATLWGYWEMIKGLSGGSTGDGVKEKVSRKLKEYKASIGRVSGMITDTLRTRFVVVCIAEYLSISESRRLLGELDRFHVVASHIVVNQLVSDYMEDSELAQLEEYAGAKDGAEGAILEKALASARLTSARRNIQSKYLKELKQCPEVRRVPNPEAPTARTNTRASTEPLLVLEVPLLPREVTGSKAILDFSHLLIGKELEKKSSKSVGVEGERSRKARVAEAEASAEEERNAKASESSSGAAKKKAKKDVDIKAAADGVLAQVMADPELAKMIEENPKLTKIVEETKENPMAALKYMSDPEVAPFVQKAMGKLMGGGSGGGGAGRKGKGKKAKGAGSGAGGPDLSQLGQMLGGLGGLEGLADLGKGKGEL